MISESCKKRIQLLSGILSEAELLEENSIDKLKNLGFSEKVGNELLEKNKKFSIFLGNILTKQFAQLKGINNGELRNILPLLDQEELYMFIQSKEDEINYVLGWLKSASEANEPVNIKSIDSWQEALRGAQEWQDATAESQKGESDIKDESGEIIKKYPDAEVNVYKITSVTDEGEFLRKVKGLYWIDLKTNNSPDESSVMHHCGKDDTSDTMISLRHDIQTRFVTLGMSFGKKLLKQVKAKWNARPKVEYMPYVYDILYDFVKAGKMVGVQWSYSPYGDDLNQEDIKKVFKEKYPEYIYNILISSLDNTMYSKLPVSVEEAKIIVGESLYKKYIFKLLGKILENPAYNKLEISQEEIKQTIGEENHKKFIAALIDKLLQGDNIHSLGTVIQKLKNSYEIEINQQELKQFVGTEKYRNYIQTLLNKAMENPVVNKLEVTKQEIIDELGADAYVAYINKILEKILENPINKKLNLSKEEIVDSVGEVGYNRFINSVIREILEAEANYGLNTVIGILSSNYDVALTPEQIKVIIGDARFRSYIQKIYDRATINPFENKLDTDKEVIIEELGLEAYARFVSRILDVSTEDPKDKKLKVSKEEIISLLGQNRYDEFVKKLLLGFLNDKSFFGELRLLNKLRENFDVELTSTQIRQMVGPQIWFMFLKRSKFQPSSLRNLGHL